MAALDTISIAILLGSLLVLAGILSSLIALRFGAPLLLVFLILGMLAGEGGPGGIPFNNVAATYTVGSIALALILFDGGLRTRLASFRSVLAPAVTLATAGVLDAEGWFHSGDLARVDDDGDYWIMGRSKDVIISGGENIYPAELEGVLAECPAIAESAVVGVADAKWGEAACAVVVRRPGAVLDEAAVLALFKDRLARYKHPRRVVFADALPKNALGKVQKHELKKRL